MQTNQLSRKFKFEEKKNSCYNEPGTSDTTIFFFSSYKMKKKKKNKSSVNLSEPLVVIIDNTE